MGKRREASGYSLVIGVDKPAGMTSHDVVDRIRRIYGERRVGHTGTLDPAATGALAVCVGPATRLDRFLVGHRKEYEFTVVFGAATDTDDAQGRVIEQLPVPVSVGNEAAVRAYLDSQLGTQQQRPPAYSAIKVNGKKSYAEARRGNVIELALRPIEIYKLDLVGLEQTEDTVSWRVRAEVSAGTYVRSIARDAGLAFGTCAHVGSLRRLRSGSLAVEDCLTLDEIERNPHTSALDPLTLLNRRILFAGDGQANDVAHGRPLVIDNRQLVAFDAHTIGAYNSSCTSGFFLDETPVFAGEQIGIVADNKLIAIYEYDASRAVFKSACGFATGVNRGFDIYRR